MTGSRMHSAPLHISESGRGLLMHMMPAYGVHVGEEALAEAWLTSAQASVPSTLPMPQVMAHACVAPVALRQLGSFVQVFEQPLASPKNRPFGPLQPVGYIALSVPQSQPSFPSLTPLPQIAAVH